MHYTQLRLKHFPEIDDKSMVDFIAEYEPSALFSIHSKQEPLVQIGPLIDVNEKSAKINFATTDEVKTFYTSGRQDLIKSFVIHGGLVVCYVILNYISLFRNSTPAIVEVTFGLTDTITQSQPEETTKQPEGQTEATKTIQDLPQLPKNSSPDTGPKPSPENDNANLNKKDDLTLNENKKVIPPEKKEKQEVIPKKVGPKVDTSQRNIDEKDYLKRKEEDLRKIAQEKQQGVHGKNPIKPEGQKHSPPGLPKSPFQNSDDIPLAPPGIAPAGDEKGTNVANYDAYRAYLKNQLKMNWNTNEGAAFPKTLKTVVEFTINPFGYLIGKPKIDTSSGNKDFDALAIQAVQGTFPVSTPPPKSIHPPQTFKAAYSAKDVN